MKFTVQLDELRQSLVAPASARLLDGGVLFVDFGRAVYGTLIFTPPPGAERVVVHLGEKLDDTGRIDRDPGATIRYRRVEQAAEPGKPWRLIIAPDEKNTGPAAIGMPESVGEVLPFRYVEIEQAAGVDPASIRQVYVHYPFDDNAASFDCSNEVLNRVWDLCKHTIKATTFCGVYVDGDRERIPYEGDAYINQLGHYCMDHEYDFARYSHEYMIQRPTWCTEWHLHSVMMAWADALYSGRTDSLREFYDELRAKTLIDFARDDGLISVDPALRTDEMAARVEPHFQSGIIRRNIRDVMDWPPGSFTDGGTGERDNHQMLPINTVTNAFHCHALKLMAGIARLLGRDDDAARFDARATAVNHRINDLLFDSPRGIYIDGEGSTHASLHSNMFMLAFGLAPESRTRSVIDFVKSRGMACSVYGAQHLLDALYRHGEDHYALDLMTAQHDRSWWNMIAVGSTMTLEAWDARYKNNLDWNHAWGAAPANIVGRYVLGVRPLTPGFDRTIIQPQPGWLTRAAGDVPTPRGPVRVAVRNAPGQPFELNVTIPDRITAAAAIPAGENESDRLLLNGGAVDAERRAGYLHIDGLGPGEHVLVYA